jgi:carbamoyltransferase
MAGGVALNSVGNGKIVKEAPFEHIYIQPAAGDDGGALGAALHGYHTVLEQPRKLVMEHAYWGEQHCTAEVEKFLRESRIPYERLEDEEELLSRVVNALTEGKVVGWSQGRFEWGPRALGNRSILADPRRTDMKDIVNTKIKFREPYRPFAPSVLVERASEFFEIDEPEQRFPARFMLYVVKVKPDKQHLLPATTHVDGTARLQTVHRDVSPRYYRLIERFGEATGVPVLLNTSFNLRGEPIVNTPREAFQTFSKSDMDLLVLENCLVYKS